MIYICIPAYNEERTIGVLLWKIRQVLADFPRDYQILVANDGSNDDTAEVLGPYQRVLPLTVVQIEHRHGYANALELLVREAARRAEYPKRDVIVTLQADFTDDPAELTPMLKRIEAGADVVCANAKMPDTAPRSIRWARKVGNFLLRRRGWPEGVTDPLCGLRAYRVLVIKRAIEARGPDRLLTWEGWAANAELLQLVQPHARRAEAIDIAWRADRQQRESRLTFWAHVGLLNRFARGGPGPLAGVPLTVPVATVDLRNTRGRHGQDRNARPETTRPAARGREAPGRERRPRPDAGQRTARPAREPREAREARPPRPESGTQARRPERSRRERPPRKAETPASAQPPEVRTNGVEGQDAPAFEPVELTSIAPAPKKKRRRRRKRGGAASPAANAPELNEGPSEPVDGSESEEESDQPAAEGVEQAAATNGAPRKRRSRRGGRGRRKRGAGAGTSAAGADTAEPSAEGSAANEVTPDAPAAAAEPTTPSNTETGSTN